MSVTALLPIHRHLQCAIDAAGAWALDPDRRTYLQALQHAPRGRAPPADEALLLELRGRLVAAGLGELSCPLARSLRAAQPLGAVQETEGDEGDDNSGSELLLFKDVAASVREGSEPGLAGGRIAWPGLRRALAAASARYLEPILGGSNRESVKVVMTGGQGSGPRRLNRWAGETDQTDCGMFGGTGAMYAHDRDGLIFLRQP